MRIVTLAGLFFAALAAVFYFANIASNALVLLVIVSVVCLGIGLLTGK